MNVLQIIWSYSFEASPYNFVGLTSFPKCTYTSLVLRAKKHYYFFFQRETFRGAPVVLNRVLWGVTSSWMPQYCDQGTTIFVNLVSSKDISKWIKYTMANNI